MPALLERILKNARKICDINNPSRLQVCIVHWEKGGVGIQDCLKDMGY